MIQGSTGGNPGQEDHAFRPEKTAVCPLKNYIDPEKAVLPFFPATCAWNPVSIEAHYKTETLI